MSSEQSAAAEENSPESRGTPQSQEVTIRRAPKYSVFMFLGGLIVVLAALFTTYAFPEVEGETTWNQVFSYLLLPSAAIGAALGGIVALIIDWTIGNRTKKAQAQITELSSADELPPTPDTRQ